MEPAFEDQKSEHNTGRSTQQHPEWTCAYENSAHQDPNNKVYSDITTCKPRPVSLSTSQKVTSPTHMNGSQEILHNETANETNDGPLSFRQQLIDYLTSVQSSTTFYVAVVSVCCLIIMEHDVIERSVQLVTALCLKAVYTLVIMLSSVATMFLFGRVAINALQARFHASSKPEPASLDSNGEDHDRTPVLIRPDTRTRAVPRKPPILERETWDHLAVHSPTRTISALDPTYPQAPVSGDLASYRGPRHPHVVESPLDLSTLNPILEMFNSLPSEESEHANFARRSASHSECPAAEDSIHRPDFIVSRSDARFQTTE